MVKNEKPLKVYTNKNDFLDVLVHEMIHNIHDDNANKMKKWRNFIDKKYKNENQIIKNHISLQAVHWKLFVTLLNEKRLKRKIKRSPTADYKRS